MNNNPFSIKYRASQATYVLLLITYLPLLVYSGYQRYAPRTYCKMIAPKEIAVNQMIPRAVIPPPKAEVNELISIVEEMPMFPGCFNEDYTERKRCAQKKMLEFIYSNIKYPAIDRDSGFEGMMVISFSVEKDGRVTNIAPHRELSPSFTKEAIRVIQSMPTWIPARQNGVPVKVQFNLPLRIHLEQ